MRSAPGCGGHHDGAGHHHPGWTRQDFAEWRGARALSLLHGAPISHLTGAYLVGTSAYVQHDQAMQENLDLDGAVLAEFLAAGIVVVGTPLYSFTIPSQLKTWVDRIVVAGKTFHDTDNGPEGLAGGKRVVLTLSRGGFYGTGTPAAPYEHGESCLRVVFGFIGNPGAETILAEGVATGAEQRQKALDAALAQAAALD